MSAPGRRRDGCAGGFGGKGAHGFALLIVLWTLVLLGLMASALALAGRRETTLADNLRHAAVLDAAAEGAVHAAAFHLLDGSAGHWPADGAVHALTLAEPKGATALVRIRSEAGKVNPNTARPELLAALLRESGTGLAGPAADRLAGAIVAWRAPPGQTAGVTAQPGQAYGQAYSGLGYAPPQAPFESMQELGLVIGMTPTILDRLRPHLSLYHAGDPDPGAADAVVLAALKDVSGTVPAPRASAPDQGVALVQVTVRDAAGAKAERSAIVQTGASGNGSGAKPFRILSWHGAG